MTTLTVEQVAAVLGCHRETARDLIASRRIIGFKAGRRWNQRAGWKNEEDRKQTGALSIDMQTKVVTTCDSCGFDLSETSNCVDFRLVLFSQSIPGYGSGAYTSMMKYPPIKEPAHFCNMGCLREWLSRQPNRKERPGRTG